MNKPTPETETRGDVACTDLVIRRLFDDWQPVHATMIWYRFGKLTNPKNRETHEIPIGFGWMFNTDKMYLNSINLPPEQNPNHTCPTRKIRRRIEFWKRWLDPVILPPGRLFCRVIDLVLRVFAKPSNYHQDEETRPPETLERSDHLLAVRSPATGMIEWANFGAMRRLFYGHCEK